MKMKNKIVSGVLAAFMLFNADSSQVEKKFSSPRVLLFNYIIMTDELSHPSLILDHLIQD